MKNWKVLSRETILDQGKFLRVENHVVQLPDGRIIDNWPWIITPDFVNVVAITTEGSYLIFEQTKYSIEGTTLATIGGYIDPGESPLTAAKRELREETGYAAESWQSLGSYPVDGNRGAGTAHLFLALNAQKVTEIDADDLEDQKLLLFTQDQILTALHEGRFKLLPWAAAIALALHYKKQQAMK